MAEVNKTLLSLDDHMVSKCYRLSDGTVLKEYINDPKLRSQLQNAIHWQAETQAMVILNGMEHFAELHIVDHVNRTITMSYCGDVVNKDNLPPDWIDQCTKIGMCLRKLCIFHNDVFCKNITVLDGVMYLIDFGMWSNVPGVHNSMIEAIDREVL